MSITAQSHSGDCTSREAYSFTLVLGGVTEINEQLEEAVFAAGCGDALLHAVDGVVSLDFIREADSIEEAITGAIESLEANAPWVHVVRVAPFGERAIADINAALRLRTDRKAGWLRRLRDLLR